MVLDGSTKLFHPSRVDFRPLSTTPHMRSAGTVLMNAAEVHEGVFHEKAAKTKLSKQGLIESALDLYDATRYARVIHFVGAALRLSMLSIARSAPTAAKVELLFPESGEDPTYRRELRMAFEGSIEDFRRSFPILLHHYGYQLFDVDLIGRIVQKNPILDVADVIGMVGRKTAEAFVSGAASPPKIFTAALPILNRSAFSSSIPGLLFAKGGEHFSSRYCQEIARKWRLDRA